MFQPSVRQRSTPIGVRQYAASAFWDPSRWLAPVWDGSQTPTIHGTGLYIYACFIVILYIYLFI